MELPEDVLEDIRRGVECGYENRAQLCEGILDMFWEALEMQTEPIPEAPGAVRIIAGDPTNESITAAIRSAIDEAFARKADAMRSWPAVTDNDRLRVAFAALDRQGIVALENAGLTQHHGTRAASDVGMARDELGTKNHGYCFFTSQSTQTATEGDGLLLAFGAFQDEELAPPPPKAPEPAPCPKCRGRGWIAAADPAQFPTTCSCRAAGAPAPAAPPPPPPTLAAKVGADIAQACRDAGLAVEWDGTARSCVILPTFRWQRRILTPSAGAIQEFLESWDLELRAGYWTETELVSELEERANDWFESATDFGPALLHILRDHTEKRVIEERAREALWSGATANDRIAAAFAELGARGYLAFENDGLTIQDGWSSIGTVMTGSERGAVFFHREDVLDGVEGRGLGLAFGAFGKDQDIAVGHEIVAVFASHGVAVAWTGSARDRIRVLPFVWQKRRWTTAPPHDRAEVAALRPPTVERPDLRKQFVERGLATVVKAHRTTAGFDLRISRRLRAAWASLDASEPGHACHLGTPHMFVRRGAHTTLAAQSAWANLRMEEAAALRERGARARAAMVDGTT